MWLKVLPMCFNSCFFSIYHIAFAVNASYCPCLLLLEFYLQNTVGNGELNLRGLSHQIFHQRESFTASLFPERCREHAPIFWLLYCHCYSKQRHRIMCMAVDKEVLGGAEWIPEFVSSLSEKVWLCISAIVMSTKEVIMQILLQIECTLSYTILTIVDHNFV